MRKAGFSLQDLKKSKVAGINHQVIENVEKGKKKKKKHPQLPGEMCPQAQWMWGQLVAWSLFTGMEVRKEYEFHHERNWRFDFAIPSHLIGIEYEGLMSEKSGHTTLSGYTKDTDKYNAAQAIGWKVIRFTVKNFKTVISELEKQIEL